MAVRLFKDTTSPSLSDTITVNGSPADLTGATVRFRMRPVGSSTLKVDAAATLVAATATVSYDWAAADVDTAGDYLGWWRFTLQNGDVQESAEFPVEILDHAPTTTPALCTLSEVRDWLGKPGGDRDQDQVIEAVILRASRAILTYLGREVVVNGSNPQTRVYPVAGHAYTRVVPVGDMASTPTAVLILGEDGSTVSTLTVASDVQVWPLVRWPWEPVTHLRLRDSAGTLDARYQLSVTGSWGWPSVPEDVTQAAVMTAGSWVRRYVQAFTTSYSPEVVEEGVPESIPGAARALLHPFRMVVVA